MTMSATNPIVEEQPTETAAFPRPNPMDEAHRALRCCHIKVDGVRCGSPAMRGDVFCYFHNTHFYNVEYQNELPPLEDGNAIQVALQKIIHDLRNNRVDAQVAKILIYGLQTAASNLPRVKLDPDQQLLTATPSYSHLEIVPGQPIPAPALKGVKPLSEEPEP